MAGIALTAAKENSGRLLWILGLAITLPMILVSGPLAGYFVSFILIRNLGAPEVVTPVLMALGLAGSGLQTYRIIKKINETTKK